MGPIDYNIDVANPFDSAIKGFQAGVGIRDVQLQQQQQQAALQQKQQQYQVIQSLISNPGASAEDYANATLLVPGLREQLKQAWDTKNTAQQQSHLSDLSQWGAAIQNGKPEIAVDAMNARADAMENTSGSPTKESQALRAQAQVIKEHPEFGNFMIKSLLVAHPDGGKVVESIAKLGGEQRAEELHPSAVNKADADARAAGYDADTKAITAKYADSQALADLTKKKWDVTKIVADIDFQKESNRIAAMNAAASKEGNKLRRQELQIKIDEARTTRDDKLREKVAKAESGAAAMDNMLNTVERLLKNPALNDVVGSIEGRDLYPNTAVAMATNVTPYGLAASSSDDRADAIALLDTLGSQAFLSQVPTVQGMGSLSNAEGEKLQAALQNLSRRQSESQVRANLAEVKRLVGKGRDNVSKRYGVPLGAPDTPAAPAGEKPPIDSFFR